MEENQEKVVSYNPRRKERGHYFKEFKQNDRKVSLKRKGQ